MLFKNPFRYAAVHHALRPRREALNIRCNFRVLHQLLARVLRALGGLLGEVVLGGSRKVPVRLSLDPWKQIHPVALEERMPKFYLLNRTLYLVEVIHVKLAYEGVEVAVFEMDWQDRIREARAVLHLEEAPVATPGDAVFVLVLVDDLEELGKKIGHALLTRFLRGRFIHSVIVSRLNNFEEN